MKGEYPYMKNITPSKAKNAINILKKAIIKHSPEILTITGIIGFTTTAILASKSTLRAHRIIEEKKEELISNNADSSSNYDCYDIIEYSNKDAIRDTWKCFIPTAISYALSCACIISSNRISNNRTKGLEIAFALASNSLSNYKDKVIETIGEKKELLVKDSIAKEKIGTNEVSEENVYMIDNYTSRVFDPISSRYFTSSIDKLKSAVIDMNKIIMTDPYDTGASLNDFYAIVGLPDTLIGDKFYWSNDNGLMDLYFSSHIDSSGRPCIVIDYTVFPAYDPYR